jgi:hypothetical protein
MKNILRQSDGMYHVGNKKYNVLEGSRAAVMHETAYKTSGGLTAKDLVYSKKGRIVSKNKSIDSKRNNRLKAHGWTYKKGKFGPVQMNKSRKNRNRK